MKSVGKRDTILIALVVIFFPILIGIFTSVSIWPRLSTENEWIGFWGGYSGSIVGGIITLIVMNKTLTQNQAAQKEIAKRELCNRASHLVSSFCREMLAYRGKWAALKRQSQDGPIDQMKKIEFQATTELARESYFELEMLLTAIPSSKDILDEMKTLLDETHFSTLTISEADKLLIDLRSHARDFINDYMEPDE